MICPKCGASQEAEREDCAVCGVIFERWYRAQEQVQYGIRRTAQSQEVVPAETGGGVPRWMLALFVGLLCVLGLVWTVQRREARGRASNDTKDEINRINNEGLRVRQQLAEEQARADRERDLIGRQDEAEENSPQFSLTEAAALGILRKQCTGFFESKRARIPKQYDSNQSAEIFRDYPATEGAQKSQLLFTEHEGTLVKHRVGFTGGIRIDEAGDFFEIDLGPRQLLRITRMEGTSNRVRADFAWGWEQRNAAQMLFGGAEQSGGAWLDLQGVTWRVSEASLNDGKTIVPCGG